MIKIQNLNFKTILHSENWEKKDMVILSKTNFNLNEFLMRLTLKF